MVIQKTKK